MILSPYRFVIGGGGGSVVTWNPADKSAEITLSGGNLTATKITSNNANNTARATVGYSSGKYYFEVLAQEVSSSNFCSVGLSNTAHSTAAWCGGTANSWAYYQQTGQKYTNNTGAAYGTTWVNGDVLGVAWDATAGTLTFYKNNVSQGVAFTGLSGTLFPSISLYRNSGPQHVMVGRFKTADFSYTPPAGHSPWGV